MIWPFRKKPEPKPPVRDRRESGWSWKVGDLAECIDDNWNDVSPNPPKVGDILRVAKIEDAVNRNNTRAIWLTFETTTGFGYNTQAFRKIILAHDDDEVEEGIVNKIKRAAKQGADA